MTDKQLKRLSYVVLIGPGLLIYASIVIFPIFFSLVLSFSDWNLLDPPTFVGLEQYRAIFRDPVFWHGLRNNLFVVATSVFGQIPLGFMLAYIIHRRLVRGPKFFETMIFLPITMSSVVLALLWDYVFSPIGFVTAIVRAIRDDPRYFFTVFEDKAWAIFPILFVILWVYTGLYMVIYIANLQKIPPSIIEAAIIDGASEGQVLRHAVFPSMVGVLFTTAVFGISGSLKSFDLIYAMTGGGPAHYTEVIAIYMYNNTFKWYQYGLGSAVSILIITFSFGLITILNQTFGRLMNKYEG